MTEVIVIGIIAVIFGWGYLHWRTEAKYLRMMWKHEHEMNTALFDQIRDVERPKKTFLVDSAMMSQLRDEERQAFEDADRSDLNILYQGTKPPMMVEEPLPPGTVLHQEPKQKEKQMELALNFITMYSPKGKFSRIAVEGPTPFFRSDIFQQKSESSEVAELQTWVSILINKMGNKMAFLSEAPQCALIEFGHKVRNDRDLGTQIVLIVEIEKDDGSKHYWWASVPTFILKRFLGDLETLSTRFANPLGDYVCREIRKEVNPTQVKKCTAFVTDAYQTPRAMNEPEHFTEVFISQLMFGEEGKDARMG